MRINNTKLILLFGLFFLFAKGTLAANRYWIATVTANWDDIANWSATSGGTGGASVPGSGDFAIYDGAGGSNGNCILNIAPTIGGMTSSGYSGTIDLNGNNLTVSSTANMTFSSGTITNSLGTAASCAISTTGIVTFSGTTFGASTSFAPVLTCSAGQIYLNGSTFYGTTSLAKTGGTNNLGNGGNVFHGLTTLSNSGSGFFATAFITPDIFHTDLTLTNTGSAWIAMSDHSIGNQYNGNIIINSTNGTASAGITFGNGPGTAISSTLASGKTITVGSTGFSAGRLLLKCFTQLGTTPQSLIFTGTGILYLGPLSTFNGDVDFRTPQIYLNDCTYNRTAYLEKKGATNNSGTGGNIFNGATTLVNSGTGYFVTAATVADTFNTDLTLINTGSSSVGLSDISAGTRFNGNIIVNSTAGVGVTIGWNAPGASSMAEGKTISVGGTGFSGGALEIRRFTQGTTVGGTAQNLTFTGTGILRIGPSCVFNGNVNFTAPQIYLNGCTYNGTADMVKNGNTATLSNGSNIFNGTTNLTNSSTAEWRLGNTTGDTYNAAITFVQSSSGAMSPAYNSTSYFSSDIVINSATSITFGSGAGIVEFTGGSNQSLTSASSTPLIQRFVMNKSAGTLTLNAPLNIGLTATFTSGIINSTASNYLNFISGSTASGFGNASHVNGPVRKTGNSAFTFPVGNSGIYRGISISAPGNATDHFTAQYFKAGQSYGDYTTYDPSFATLSSCEYWILDRTNGTSNVSVTLSWNTPDCGASYITDVSSLRVSRWNGSSWTDEGNGGTTGSAAAGTIISGAAVSSFSPFTLASTQAANSLPVELLSFNVLINGRKVDVNWVTQTENDNDYFTVEKSNDGTSFEEVGIVQAGENNQSVQNYTLHDFDPWNGVSYYRLKQTDTDGKFVYLGMEAVNMDLPDGYAFSIYPNPLSVSDNQLHFHLRDLPKNESVLFITDLSGKTIYSKTIYPGNKDEYLLDLENKLTAGMYSVILQTSSELFTRKLMVLPAK
ncbi:MAG: hypothetical protein K0S23_1520 [Fluviicola sp.]|jgi:hypothetical protein|uniref:T9SS type A sorting domain-containing protein n=1 Tax=Fluviicola sp. TaxID=1917219 RepID=UPI00260C1A83|nr:T9SS type A sorting domain-containing protein [Fluviicola sp.]MDF3027213.1 hypothetical protein [Fluviicola sp.]